MQGLTENTAAFQLTRNENGMTATRVFYFNSAADATGDETLPEIGDICDLPIPLILSNPFPSASVPYSPSGLICRSQDWQPMAGHPDNWVITCSYTNEPVDVKLFADQSDSPIPTAIEDLPLSLEINGEYVYINPDLAAGWTWKTGATPVKQPIPFKVNGCTLRLTRYVSDQAYFSFLFTSKAFGGHVNDQEDPFGPAIGGGIGSWVYNGAHTEIFRDSTDTKWWKCDLEFAYRDPDGTDEEGWNKLLRLDGLWDQPINPKAGSYTPPRTDPNNSLYQHAPFGELFVE